ncbi:hypothetical protein DIPPA_16728 [Diplonema papillatum]|nr:hypothetical protein DIPPA_16728 [Diplonema papillatum]
MKPQPPVRPPSTNAFVTKAAVNARSTYILSTARAAQASQGTPEHSCQSTPRGVRIALIGGLPPTSTSMFGLKGRPLSGFKRRQ